MDTLQHLIHSLHKRRKCWGCFLFCNAKDSQSFPRTEQVVQTEVKKVEPAIEWVTLECSEECYVVTLLHYIHHATLEKRKSGEYSQVTASNHKEVKNIVLFLFSRDFFFHSKWKQFFSLDVIPSFSAMKNFHLFSCSFRSQPRTNKKNLNNVLYSLQSHFPLGNHKSLQNNSI